MKKEQAFGYAFPLSLQMAAPPTLEDSAFHEVLADLQQNGFYGVELNITDFESYSPQQYIEVLEKFNLKLTKIATGAYAKQNGLSLSSLNPEVRRKSVASVKKIVEFAAQIPCGIICGFMKGPAGENKAAASETMKKSLAELSDTVRQYKVPLIVEATNHYEASVAVSVQQAASLVQEFENPYLQILPDSYHMSIEEKDMAYALLKNRSFFQQVHLSDNNRYFPGYGAINFFEFLCVLKGMDYNGTIAVEGNLCNSLRQDIAFTAAYLQNVSKRLETL
ncbi:MAG: sugar phosphate isomerase/epimerase family protein [Oscillospiraceae bacterium]